MVVPFRPTTLIFSAPKLNKTFFFYDNFDAFDVIHAGNSYANGLIDRNGYQGKTKEQGLNRIDLGFRSFNPTTGIFDRSDPLAEMTPDFSPFSYVFNNPVNVIDEWGLSGSGWNTRGRQETEAETANKEQMQQSGNVSFIQGGFRDSMTQSGSGKVGGANNGNENESWYQKGNAYLDRIGVGQPLMEINEWNPLQNVLSGLSGIFTGKDVYGRKMDGLAPTMSIIAAFPIARPVKAVAPLAKKLPIQIHHFATNKNSRFTPLMKEITDKFKLDLIFSA